MEIMTMGKVVVAAKIENLRDLYSVQQGLVDVNKVRKVEVTDALVDTGAVMLSIPKKLIKKLGLKRQQTRTFRTSSGLATFGIYDVVRLTVQGRDCSVEVAEVPDSCPVLIGQICLEMLDFVVDTSGRRLIGNPEHKGKHMFDLF